MSVQAVTSPEVRVEVSTAEGDVTSMELNEVTIFGSNQLTLAMNDGMNEADGFAGLLFRLFPFPFFPFLLFSVSTFFRSYFFPLLLFSVTTFNFYFFPFLLLSVFTFFLFFFFPFLILPENYLRSLWFMSDCIKNWYAGKSPKIGYILPPKIFMGCHPTHIT